MAIGSYRCLLLLCKIPLEEGNNSYQLPSPSSSLQQPPKKKVTIAIVPFF
jgi:hypothetical protein